MKFLVSIYQDEDGVYIAEGPPNPGLGSPGANRSPKGEENLPYKTRNPSLRGPNPAGQPSPPPEKVNVWFPPPPIASNPRVFCASRPPNLKV